MTLRTILTKKKRATQAQAGTTSSAEPAPPAPAASRLASSSEAVRVHIAKRAYELYLHRGARDGFALDDWLDAEREIFSREAPN